MSDDNITYLHGHKNKPEDMLLEAIKTISEAPAESAPSSAGAVAITGNGNIVGSGNTINNVVHLSPPKVQKVIKVKTGDGVVTAAQKQKIKAMLYEWVDSHNTMKKKTLSYGLAWRKLTDYVGVNSYHEISINDYEKATKWLQKQLRMLRNMASAPKKLDTWRTEQIKSIQARCSEKGWQIWRKEHIAKKFGKTSMTELTDTELKQLYQTVWGKR